MNKHKEALQKIIEVTLAQSTANKIATEALQSESEQPKSESRMYSEDEVCGFALWYKEMDGWVYLEDKSTKEVFEIYIQSLQPKTEEKTLTEHWGIKEQHTSPSIEMEGLTVEEILEGNKLIAEFMDKPEWGNEFNVSHNKYHFSWDWLMPVYIKIAKEEKLWGDYEENIIIFNIMYDRLGDAEGIDKVYESVVEFIKWYNQNLTK